MSDLNPQAIREAKLPVGLRGFDQTATREHLERAAAAHEALLVEIRQLRASLEDTPKAAAMTDEEQVARMTDTLLAAKRTADQIVRDAEEKAAALLSATETERRQILDQATAQTTDRLATIDEEIKALIRERDDVRATIAEERVAFRDTLRGALKQLDAEEPSLSGTLRSRLTPGHHEPRAREA